MTMIDVQQRHVAVLMATLGMPSGSEWVMIWARHAVRQREPAETFIRLGSEPADLAHRFTMPPDEARPMVGFTFEMLGRVVDEPRTPLYWQIAPSGGFERELRIEVWWFDVRLGSGLRALRTHESLTGSDRKVVEVTGDDWERSIDRAKRGLRALEMKVMGAGGRPEGKKAPDPGFADRFYRALRTRYDGGKGHTERPSQEEVADDMGESVDTLQRRIRDLPLPWPPPWPPE